MADIVDKATRSRMMAGIRAKDTKPEWLIRRGLHARGLRYRLHVRTLPGQPDLVFPAHRAIIFIHGCFWHGHDCPLFRWPTTRIDFWQNKISATQMRDAATLASLQEQGWRVLVIWECALKGPRRQPLESLLASVTSWVQISTNPALKTIRGLISADQ